MLNLPGRARDKRMKLTSIKSTTKYIVALIVVLIWTLGNAQETEDDLEQTMRTSIVNYINSTTDRFGNHFLIAGFVALVFHDCVGGCDGCINDIHPQNVPVVRYIDAAENIYSNYSQSLSRADFWALAGIVATDMALGYNNGSIGTHLVYRPGRVDCPTSPFTKKFNKFPTNGGHGDFNDMLDFLQRHFNYSDRQVVAIMGAHNLGRMSREQSGFIGPWTPCPDVLDNAYFRDLVQNDWVQVNTVVKTTAHRDSHDKFQWTDRLHVPDTFDHNVEKFLNVDIAIYRDISTTSNGKVELPLNQTAFSRTKAIVEEFAENNGIWLMEFISAFQAMIQSGCEENGLKLSPIEKQYPTELPWSLNSTGLH